MFQNEHWWNLIFFLAWHVIESLLHKEESSLIFSAKKLICIGEKSVPQTACLLSEVKKIYSRAFIQVIAQHFIAKGSNVIGNLQQSCLQEGELSAEIDDIPSQLA